MTEPQLQLQLQLRTTEAQRHRDYSNRRVSARSTTRASFVGGRAEFRLSGERSVPLCLCGSQLQ